MKKLVLGILAHVDAGKTTLSEAMLYRSGSLRRLGRVDHGDTFLDTDAQERERGITIFSKQAMLQLKETEVALLDTPGHVDFSAEMERTLQVLDAAVLVLSGTDGVQGHTRTLLTLLSRYEIPTFIFINKMDLKGTDKNALLSQLHERGSIACVDFTAEKTERDENIAMADEAALEEFLTEGSLCRETIRRLIAERKVFPCWFGSALRLEGVDEFLTELEDFAPVKNYGEEFGARVFKISRDNKNMRLTWMKITGGELSAKSMLSGKDGEETWEEKADQIRLYSGTKFTPIEKAEAGMVVAVTGLTKTKPGMGLGTEKGVTENYLEPVLNYRLLLPDGQDAATVLPKLRQLEEEDPLLRIIWNEAIQEIHVRLMGQVQLEVLKRVIRDRFSINVEFDTGHVVYRETIAAPVIGMGHFEPLRHYAEVHLLLEPGKRGSGFKIATALSTDTLELNWQRLILTHLIERDHPGVLTGSAITDIKITLVAGRAHLKHTEGGDFRQATYRAVRQGLMQAKSILLEPYYDFILEVPHASVGRAMTDLQNMGAVVEAPVMQNELSVLTGYAPVAALQNYWQEVTAYTRGLGQISYTLRGYEPCRNAEEIIKEIGYEAEHDVANPPDSVFCSHGGGFTVKWNEVKNYMHLDSGIRLNRPAVSSAPKQPKPLPQRTTAEQDKELMAIFERTYGKIQRRDFGPRRDPALSDRKTRVEIIEREPQKEYLLVDGYNIIFAWDELKALSQLDLAAARNMLEDILVNYRAYHQCEVILVFDAYRVKGNPGSVEKRNGISVVYTKEAEIADVYIEKTAMKLEKGNKVRVATSDRLEQMIIIGHGAMRLSADAFRKEMEDTQVEISRMIEQYNSTHKNTHRLMNTARITRKNEEET
ncbi:MAG: GTP-binding protein [Clostridiales bacterium]|nr:GTP-binding protein [Clostridiales bacterium]